MSLDLQPATVPLRPDADGVVRVGSTRVTLESVLSAYLDGESAEGIVECFPALDLADVHSTIAWFLRHRPEAETYLAQSRRERRDHEVSARRHAPAAAMRAQLVARRPK